MAITATIQDGKVVCDAPVTLPNGTRVRLVADENAIGSKPLSERWSALEGLSVELPPDAAAQHDHYLYGLPKK